MEEGRAVKQAVGTPIGEGVMAWRRGTSRDGERCTDWG